MPYLHLFRRICLDSATYAKTRNTYNNCFCMKGEHNSRVSRFNSRRTRRLTQCWERDSGSGCGRPERVCHQRYDTDDKLTNSCVFLISRFIVSIHERSRKMSAHDFISTFSSFSRGKVLMAWKQNSYTNNLNTFPFAHIDIRRPHLRPYVQRPVTYRQLLHWCEVVNTAAKRFMLYNKSAFTSHELNQTGLSY